MLEDTPTVKAIRVRLRTRIAFPPDDPFSILLLRLMAATNDVRHVQRLVLVTRDPVSPPSGPAEKLVQDGEVLYFVRLLFGHLYEAGLAFRALDDQRRAEVEAAVAGDARLAAALGRLRELYGDTSEHGFYRQVFGKVRNLAAFHYKDNVFLECLEQIQDDTELVIAEYAGFNRYAVTDALLDKAVVAATGGSFQSHLGAVGRALTIAEDLETVVGTLVSYFLERRPDAWHPGEEELLLVPAALQKEAIARRAVAADRSRGIV